MAHPNDVTSHRDRGDLQRRDGDHSTAATTQRQPAPAAAGRQEGRQEGAVPVGVEVGPLGLVVAGRRRNRNRKYSAYDAGRKVGGENGD